MKTRFFNALKSDIIFQFKQGFYYVYIFLTVVYMVVISKLPGGAVKDACIPLTVFSDPSLIGFLFVGGIAMLEKDQGMLKYLAVTPLDAREYLLSKAVSLSLVSLFAGSIITLACFQGSVNWLVLILGILLSSSFFTIYGFIAAAKSRTINEYYIKMVPYLLLIVIPPFSVIGFPFNWIFDIFPSVAGLRLIMGAFDGLTVIGAAPYIIILLAMNWLVLKVAERSYLKITVSEEA